MKNQHTYPIFIDMRGMRCLVVGGGRIAYRKIKGLIDAGAQVRIVSPELTDELVRLVRRKGVEYLAERYSSKHLKDCRMVIAATDDHHANGRVFRDAERKGVLVNVVDDIEHCRFIAPARYTAGSLEVAVTTGGAAPMIAKAVRDEIAKNVGEKYAPAVEALGKRRSKIKRLPPANRAAFWENVMERLPQLIECKGQSKAAVSRALDTLLQEHKGTI